MVAGLNQVLHKVVPQKRLPEGGMHEFANMEVAKEYVAKYAHNSDGSPYKEHHMYIDSDGSVTLMPIDNNTANKADTYIYKSIEVKDGHFHRSSIRQTGPRLAGSVHNHFYSPIPSAADSVVFRLAPKTNHYILYQDSLYHVWP